MQMPEYDEDLHQTLSFMLSCEDSEFGENGSFFEEFYFSDLPGPARGGVAADTVVDASNRHDFVTKKVDWFLAGQVAASCARD